jgi:hypothetical protein
MSDDQGLPEARDNILTLKILTLEEIDNTLFN